tara:strand:+ start:625 stop:1236 length:612 start_codon:yes stop_codon:yes gene_type:complete
MITIVITGPSGSGKSLLTHKLLKLFEDSIVIKTDSFYRDNVLIKLLSLFKFDIYDKLISIKLNEINRTINSIYNQETLVSFYHYDFHRKKSYKSKIRIDYKGKDQFLILEGIFSHRLNLNYDNTLNIICEDEKQICYKRRLRRDQLERGRNSKEVNKKFDKSWSLFYQNIEQYKNLNKIILLNTLDKISYDKLVNKLRNLKKN